MQIANSTNDRMGVMKDLMAHNYMDSLDDSLPTQGPRVGANSALDQKDLINNDVFTMIHQMLGQKMTQVNTVV